MDVEKVEINPRFKKALDIMNNTNDTVFITGKAGTGKSTLLSYFTQHTDKRPVILAPTGVAALNVNGQTIHKFFNFYIDITIKKIIDGKNRPRKPKLIKNLKMIVIDEISMVRADLLDCVNVFLQMYGPKPGEQFGGVQMIFIGDLYQLPPVVIGEEKKLFNTIYKTPYFFSANVLKDLKMDIIELEKIYRQKDSNFIQLLNKIRNNSVEDRDIVMLNERLQPDFEPDSSKFFINLTTTNKGADTINNEHLAKLKGKRKISRAEITGDFDKAYFPTTETLYYKENSQIMLLNNESKGSWVNGTIGVIKSIGIDAEGEEFLNVYIADNDEDVCVYPHIWDVYKFSLNGNDIVSESVGTFTQYPFRLAWAITIHKSQGKTFNNVIIDIGNGTFVSGQVYVALSRATSFEGVILRRPVKKHHIKLDYNVSKYMTDYQYKKSDEKMSVKEKMIFIQEVIKDKGKIKMTYLRANDTKLEIVISPISVGDEYYMDKCFIGMRAFYEKQKTKRMFRVDRILKIEIV